MWKCIFLLGIDHCFYFWFTWLNWWCHPHALISSWNLYIVGISTCNRKLVHCKTEKVAIEVYLTQNLLILHIWQVHAIRALKHNQTLVIWSFKQISLTSMDFLFPHKPISNMMRKYIRKDQLSTSCVFCVENSLLLTGNIRREYD